MEEAEERREKGETEGGKVKEAEERRGKGEMGGWGGVEEAEGRREKGETEGGGGGSEGVRRTHLSSKAFLMASMLPSCMS